MKKLLALAALAVASSAAMAQTATAPLDVTATVLKSCELATSPVNFGSFQPASTGEVDAAGAVNVTCTKTTPYTISMGTGANSSSFAARSMAGGGTNTDKLNYNLFTDPARTSVWGDGTASTSTIPGVGSGTSVNLPVYGRLSKSQFVTPDNYLDTVTVTVTY